MRIKNYSYVSMGKPVTAPCLIPVEHKSTPNCVNKPFKTDDGEFYKVTCLSFGNPHGVVFFEDVDNADVINLGGILEKHALFPDGASIVFAQVLDKTKIKARLWERGKGEISYTPEAACVAMTAARMLQKIYGGGADVFMGGKKFHVSWDSVIDDVYVAGPLDF